MTSPTPAPVDPEIAAAVFGDHVARAEASDLARDHRWVFTRLDPLHVVVRVQPADPTADGSHYFVKLGAEYYDQYPPTTAFVCPPQECGDRAPWSPAPPKSRWLPVVEALQWFAIHEAYQYNGGGSGQLVCCSMTSPSSVGEITSTDSSVKEIPPRSALRPTRWAITCPRCRSELVALPLP